MAELLRVEFNRELNAEFVTLMVGASKIHLNAEQALSLAKVLVAKLKSAEKVA